MAALLTDTGLLFVVISIISGSESSDDCRQVEFLPIEMGKRLTGHVFTNTSVTKKEGCSTLCFLRKSCMSHNLGPYDNGVYICELSDSDHNMDPEDLVPSEGYGYRATRNGCSGFPCPNTHHCLNGFGDKGYICQCPTGYEGTNCQQDEDECARSSHNCHADADCLNTVGSFSCSCKDGYYGNGRDCVDKDECATNAAHNCSGNADCSNTAGSFQCTCKEGYHGDGHNCTDEDECANGTHSCHGDADCLNTHGSFNCSCKQGYHGDGYGCADEDECTTNTHDCHGDADCSNTIGSFDCTCKRGFYGDGKNCTVIEYFIGDLAESCDIQCQKQGKRCIARRSFPGGNAKDIFARLGFPCATEQPYQYSDNPCYASSNQHCYGTTNIPDEIKCAPGHNAAVRRLCPCV